MSKLEYIDFSTENIKIKNIFKNENMLAEIKKNSPENFCMPKVTEIYSDLFFPKAPENRPYIYCSVVLSSDGKMAFTDSAAGPLIAKNNYFDPDGALADFWMLNILRAHADGVLIGAKTLHHERVTSNVYDKDLVEQRKKYLNKINQPCGIIVSFDATDILFDHMVFDVDESEEYKLVIATSPEGEKYIRANSPLKHIFIGPYSSVDEIDISSLEKLDKDYGVVPVIVTGKNNIPDSSVLLYILRKLGLQRLCIESPSFNWHLMQQGNLDEFFINYSMVFAGGNITPGISMPFDHINHPHMHLLTVGIHKSNFIYTRQKLHYGITGSIDLSIYKY